MLVVRRHRRRLHVAARHQPLAGPRPSGSAVLGRGGSTRGRATSPRSAPAAGSRATSSTPRRWCCSISDAIALPAFIGAPFVLAGVPVVLVYTGLVWLSILSAGLAMYACARYLAGSHWGAPGRGHHVRRRAAASRSRDASRAAVERLPAAGGAGHGPGLRRQHPRRLGHWRQRRRAVPELHLLRRVPRDRCGRCWPGWSGCAAVGACRCGCCCMPRRGLVVAGLDCRGLRAAVSGCATTGGRTRRRRSGSVQRELRQLRRCRRRRAACGDGRQGAGRRRSAGCSRGWWGRRSSVSAVTTPAAPFMAATAVTGRRGRADASRGSAGLVYPIFRRYLSALPRPPRAGAIRHGRADDGGVLAAIGVGTGRW